MKKSGFISLSFLWAAAGWGIMLSILAVQPEALLLTFLEVKYFAAAHMAAYAVLALFLMFSFSLRCSLGPLRLRPVRRCLLTLMLCASTGALTEALQIGSADRIADWNDLYCDLVGAGTGIALFLLCRILHPVNLSRLFVQRHSEKITVPSSV